MTPAPSEPVHGHTEPTPHHKVNYFAVFGLLMILTVVTVVVAFIGIKKEWQKVLLALVIASIKATAVVLYFMHLKFEGKLILLILAVPVGLCILLIFALLPDVTFAPDFLSWVKKIWADAPH